MILPTSEKPEGYHEHHRQKRRSGDDRPVNLLYVSPILHEWIEKHPEESAKWGWTVSQYADPADVVVVLPDPGDLKEDGPKRKEAARPRQTVSFKFPNDQYDKGLREAFDVLWGEVEDIFEREGLTVGGETGKVNVLIAIVTEFVQNHGKRSDDFDSSPTAHLQGHGE